MAPASRHRIVGSGRPPSRRFAGRNMMRGLHQAGALAGASACHWSGFLHPRTDSLICRPRASSLRGALRRFLSRPISAPQMPPMGSICRWSRNKHRWRCRGIRPGFLGSRPCHALCRRSKANGKRCGRDRLPDQVRPAPDHGGKKRVFGDRGQLHKATDDRAGASRARSPA